AQSLHKTNGKMIYDSGPKNINGASPNFALFQMDLKARTINLIGYSGSVQHYVDDGKGPPPNPQGAMLQPGGLKDGTSNTVVVGQPGVAPNGQLLPGQLPGRAIRLRFADDMQVLPVQVLPE